MKLQRRLSIGATSLCTCRELWTERDRPEILHILDGPTDYDADLIKRKYAASDIIRSFFPEARDADCIQSLAGFFVAIKHDGYVRRGMTLEARLIPNCDMSLDMSDVMGVATLLRECATG